MFTDLFSSMDGCSSFMSWLVPIVFLVLLLGSNFFIQSLSMALLLISKKLFRKSSVGLCGVFLFVLMVNLLGLFPLVFPLSSTLWFSFGLAVPMWLYLIVSSLTFNPKKYIAHFVPLGTPMYLVPALILIETVSVMIRPITLAVRLVANISAGHIILSLVAACLSSWTLSFGGFVSMSFSIFYMFFEVFVSLIQAYIFTLLISLYSEDHP
uniref:ATP synthase subunit a n=2 Tax=unclassified Physidae TaxID=1724862 RepID=A0A8F8X7B8_9GAST|nr:ATP synthase F0 subunit 6 [Physidae sp. PE4]QYB18829.1 ATP synthase F0 subunit 6 [Physidae sp. P3S_19]